MDDIHFQAQDPRGITVICTETLWNRKILDKRPWMLGWEDQIIQTISEPYLHIYQDNQYPERNIYYGRMTHKGKPQLLKVIVQLQQDGTGHIISAFPAQTGKKGERPIWPQ